MSREFGQYHGGGYFHELIRGASEDAIAGSDEITKLWGAFLTEFYEIAYAISSSEACDSGPDCPIIETLERMPELKRRLKNIEDYLEPFKRVAETAVRNKLEKKCLT